MCGNCFVEIPMTRHLLFLFLLHFSQMFSLAEKVMDSSMKGLCLNCLHLLFCHYDPHIWPSHIIVDKFNLAEDYQQQQPLSIMKL